MAQRQIRRQRNALTDLAQPRHTTPRLLTIAPVVLLFITFVLRICTLQTESLWRDEVDSIRFAFGPLSDLLNNLVRNGFNGPLYEMLLRVWLMLVGINDFALRYLSLLCGVALVALAYVFTRRIFSRNAALVTAWLMTIAPALSWYSGEGKMYTLQPALLLLALYALRRAVDAKGRTKDRKLHINPWWVVFVTALSLGYYVHLLSPLFLPVAIAFFVAWWPRAKCHWRGGLISLALCSVPYIPLAIWQVPTFIAGHETGHTFYTLDEIIYTLFYNWSAGLGATWFPGASDVLAWVPIALYVGIVFVALAGMIDAESVKGELHPMRSMMALTAWLILPILMVYLISTRAPVFEPRYLLWLAPAFYILAAVGVVWIAQHNWWAGYLMGVALSVVSLIGLYTQTVIPIRPDMRGAANYLAHQMQADDRFMFQIPYTRFAFEYYLPRVAPNLPVESTPDPSDGLGTLQNLRPRLIDGPYTNAGATPQDVNVSLFPLMVRWQRIWFIEAESGMWDSRSLARAWFDEHTHLVSRQLFHGVTVSLYERPQNTGFFKTVFLPVCLAASSKP
jgi:4-amino-4-deoxy-L-arabinose transferase-like glycosyltransferase